MELNKYQERIFEIGRVENTKLVLPEKEDKEYYWYKALKILEKDLKSNS